MVQKIAIAFILLLSPLSAQEFSQTIGNHEHKFRQMETVWPTPDSVRLASGAPGPDYWQQNVTYDIAATLDEASRSLNGQAKITYQNNAPEALTFLWFDLDANRHRQDSLSESVKVSPWTNEVRKSDLLRITTLEKTRPGIDDLSVKIGNQNITPKFRDTRMRIDLPAPLQSGASTTIEISWTFTFPETAKLASRMGYACETNARCIFQGAYWYPQLTAYTDRSGWSLEPFYEWGEFDAEFSTFSVALTVPEDLIVAASGKVVNEREVFDQATRNRIKRAKSSKAPLIIVDPEAISPAPPEHTKTWQFSAVNIRNFAFTASANYIWSARMTNDAYGNPVYLQAYYTADVASLWAQNALDASAASVAMYSKFFGAFPYEQASVAFGPVAGMEHPMLAYVGTTGDDEAAVHRLVSDIVHEVGHNYAPMSINSNERLYGWMDEGLTTFLEQFAEKAWRSDYPVDRGRAADATGYMTSNWQVPTMARQDDAFSNINHAYNKPAAAFSVLRDVVLGPEIFDEALKTYYDRWKNKRATPFDFFRTMEDVSGRDLDWFWRGWFFTTEHVDLAITQVIDISLPEAEQNAIDPSLAARKKYLVYIENLGGLPSPVLLRAYFADGTYFDRHIPADLWRRWSKARRILHMSEREIVRFELDPDALTADSAIENNVFSAPFETRDGTIR